MAEARKDCGRCGGTGIVERSRSADDPRTTELCPTCAGSGKVTDWGAAPERPPHRPSGGFIADQIRLEK